MLVDDPLLPLTSGGLARGHQLTFTCVASHHRISASFQSPSGTEKQSITSITRIGAPKSTIYVPSGADGGEGSGIQWVTLFSM